ncbi:hypothetical protein [Desulfovibrio inopinatus]|uniref:hypothetical protein n=1 Tax=Desulfovibrio inopinatus TaxID=102109 RepID=UPI0012EB1CAF|nr:hypothetical protein [Desulfovibrio inopinatus]
MDCPKCGAKMLRLSTTGNIRFRLCGPCDHVIATVESPGRDCPLCGAASFATKTDGASRKRRCSACGHAYSTVEMIQSVYTEASLQGVGRPWRTGASFSPAIDASRHP